MAVVKTPLSQVRQWPRSMWVLIICASILIVAYTTREDLGWRCLTTRGTIKTNPTTWSVPSKVNSCELLFKDQSTNQHNFSSFYHTIKRAYDFELNELLKRLDMPSLQQGHVGQLLEQSQTYFMLANASHVKTICETGFNAGHSALVWLAANKHIHVYSFDLGVVRYSKQMAAFLQATFPGRLNVTWGNSRTTVPAFTKRNPQVLCDIVVIDGGHDLINARADIKNLRACANMNRHLLIIDDHPSRSFPGIRMAWEQARSSRRIEELFKCQFTTRNGYRGFTIGRYADGNSRKPFD